MPSRQSESDCEHGYRAAGGIFDCPVCELDPNQRLTLSPRWNAVDGRNWAGATRSEMIDVVIGALEDQARGDDEWVSGHDLEVRVGAIAVAWTKARSGPADPSR